MSWNTHIPKFRRFVLQNFPFIEEDFDALTDYALICKVIEYLNNVITSQNEVVAEVESFETNITNDFNRLEGLFNDLKSFVDDYFDNLDVQEEINNKLEQMAEDGTLEEIITAYIQSNVAWTFDTVADMKLATNLIDGSYARTLGFHTLNDGGGAIYKITDSGTANEKDIIACENSLLAHLIGNGEYYPEQIGAYGDGTHDDTEYIQYLLDNYTAIKFYSKTYFAKGIKISSNLVIDGNYCTLQGNDDSVGLIIYGNTNDSVISNINISRIKLRNYTVGIYAINCRRSNFHDVKVNNCNEGAIFAGGSWINRFYSCEFNNNTSHGFECGKEITHPITQSTIVPNIATFDFYSCFFGGNGGYGVTGWMREFTFNGGHSEANALGAFNILTVNTNGVSRYSRCNTFIGVDIEGVNKGYVFEGTGECEAEFASIIGGQIDLSGSYETYKSALVFKGTSCGWNKVNNIIVDARIVQGTEGNEPYTIYCDGSTNSTIQADIKFTTRGMAYFNVYNLRYIIPNGVLRMKTDLPLHVIGRSFYNGTNIVLPAGETLPININNLCFVNALTVTTSASATLRTYMSGSYISGYQGTGSSSVSTTVVDGENKASFSFGNKGDFLLIANETANPITITNIYLDGYRVQY